MQQRLLPGGAEVASLRASKSDLGSRLEAALTAQALDELRSHMDKPLAANVVKALDKPPAGKA